MITHFRSWPLAVGVVAFLGCWLGQFLRQTVTVMLMVGVLATAFARSSADFVRFVRTAAHRGMHENRSSGKQVD